MAKYQPENNYRLISIGQNYWYRISSTGFQCPIQYLESKLPYSKYNADKYDAVHVFCI